MTALVYVGAIFAGALLLFAVQPLSGRLMLPLLGGSPAVWNTCLVFFQSALLAGYLYSHFTTKWLSLRWQILLHSLLMAGTFFLLPFAAPAAPESTASPAVWLLFALIAMVGLPFVVLSATNPLLQAWYSKTSATGAADPYFLSVASNLGSLISLLAYPFLIEPRWTLSQQAVFWKWGFLIVAGLLALCGLMALWTRKSDPVAEERPVDQPAEVSTSPWRWVVLAFIPSSWLSSVTSTATTDIAPIPLLWVVPLALYLLTYAIAFAPGLRLPPILLGKVFSATSIALVLALLIGATEPMGVVLGIHLGAFFVAALMCHCRLAAERPPVQKLTAFYLWMSVGGVLGGGFNALVAPTLFSKFGLVEYPLVILAACLLRPSKPTHVAFRKWDWILPAILCGLSLWLVKSSREPELVRLLQQLADTVKAPVEIVRNAVIFGMPLLVAFFFVDWPKRFALGLAAVLLAGASDSGPHGQTLQRERNFLGILKVTLSKDGEFNVLVHGNTVHGQQRIVPRPKVVASYLHTLGVSNAISEAGLIAAGDGRWDDLHRPLTYYHPNGPAGHAFRFHVDGLPGPRRIGVVGLGSGALASYARPNQDWVYYELDPAVEAIARDERYFTFLRDSPAKSMQVRLGDARVRLRDETDATFDVLVLDAFSSDAIPIHLLTAEAFDLYLSKLKPGGILLFHVSNRYLDLPPIVAKLAATARQTTVVRYCDDSFPSDAEKAEGKFPSQWLLVGTAQSDLSRLLRGPRWQRVAVTDETPRWTDDRSHLFGAFKKNED
jgi:SAM-dependent methyltransferase